MSSDSINAELLWINSITVVAQGQGGRMVSWEERDGVWPAAFYFSSNCRRKNCQAPTLTGEFQACPLLSL
jgi:hypothetical protein